MPRQQTPVRSCDAQTAIELLTAFKTKKDGREDIRLFSNLLFDPLGYDGIEQYEGYYLATNISKAELGLSPDGTKDSLDILYIPYGDDKVFYGRTAVFEIRVANADFDDPGKRAAACGYTDVDQLIKDGFPLIGLYHICIPRLMSKVQMKKLKYFNGEPGEKKKGWFNFLTGPHDWMPFEFTDKRMHELIRSGLPKYVAVDSFALLPGWDGKWSTVISTRFNGFTSGFFSPFTKEATIRAIKAHFLRHGGERYRKLEVYKNSENGAGKKE